MSHLRLVPAARAAIEALPSCKQIVMLHPQFRSQTALIDALLEGTAGAVLYSALSKTDGTLAGLWALLTQELADVHQLALPAFTMSLTPQAAAEQFCQAVAGLTSLTVIITDFDCADHAVSMFIAQVPDLSSAVRFVLAGRVWPQTLVRQLEAGEKRALLPVSPPDMLLDYLAIEPGKVLLEVRALGFGQVIVNGRVVDQWDGALPRALFFYFVDRGITTRDEVFSTFWPELSTREATNVFHVTKRKISEILGVDLTIYSSGFYRISPEVQLHYDAIMFVQMVQNSAIAERDEALALLSSAVWLHERAFLTGFDQPWAVRRREELLRNYVDALVNMARLYEERGQIKHALGLYIRAFGVFPQREDLARAQMRLYQAAGKDRWALAVYDSLVDELQRSLGVSPGPEAAALAEQIRQAG